MAKCGALAYLFSDGAVSHISGAAMTAATIGAVSFSRMAAKVNAYATVGIFVSFTAVCVFGMANLAPSNLAFMNFAAALPALPGLFQLYHCRFKIKCFFCSHFLLLIILLFHSISIR